MIDDLALHAPGGVVPPSLRDVIARRSPPDDNLGTFRFAGARLDDFYVEDGSRRADAFYGFVRCAGGSMVGWWRPDGEPLAQAPIVCLGSEGDLAVLGEHLQDFVERWDKGESGVDDLTRDYAPVAPPPYPERSEQLSAWFDAWSAERRRLAAADPQRCAVAERLAGLVGLPSKPWQRTFVDAIVTATQCQLFRNYVGQRPLEVTPDLETALRTFRQHDTQELPEAGLWFRASLSLDPGCVLTVKRNYIEKPNPQEITLDREGVLQDLAAMPRAPYWTPPWLQ